MVLSCLYREQRQLQVVSTLLTDVAGQQPYLGTNTSIGSGGSMPTDRGACWTTSWDWQLQRSSVLSASSS